MRCPRSPSRHRDLVVRVSSPQTDSTGKPLENTHLRENTGRTWTRVTHRPSSQMALLSLLISNTCPLKVQTFHKRPNSQLLWKLERSGQTEQTLPCSPGGRDRSANAPEMRRLSPGASLTTQCPQVSHQRAPAAPQISTQRVCPRSPGSVPKLAFWGSGSRHPHSLYPAEWPLIFSDVASLPCPSALRCPCLAAQPCRC